MLISKNHGKWVISENHRSGMMLSPPCPFPWDQCQAGAWQLTALLGWLQAPDRKGSTHGGSWPPETLPGHLPVVTLLSLSCSPALRPTISHAMVHGTLCLTDADRGRAMRWHCLGPTSSQRTGHLNVRGGRTALVHNYSLKFCSMQSPLGHSFSAMQSVLITHYEFYCSSMWNLHSAIKWRIIIPGTRSLKLIF